MDWNGYLPRRRQGENGPGASEGPAEGYTDETVPDGRGNGNPTMRGSEDHAGQDADGGPGKDITCVMLIGFHPCISDKGRGKIGRRPVRPAITHLDERGAGEGDGGVRRGEGMVPAVRPRFIYREFQNPGGRNRREQGFRKLLRPFAVFISEDHPCRGSR